MADQKTLQDNIKTYKETAAKLKKYSLFMGGTNNKNEVLARYPAQQTGYNRIWMVRRPPFLVKAIPEKLNRFKHLLEYANTGVSGLSDVTIDTDSVTGGHRGRGYEVPIAYNDNTSIFSIKLTEFSGSPVRDVINFWISGVLDNSTNITHYHGNKGKLEYNIANEFAQFIYVLTDRTGAAIEYACLLANCFPKSINLDPYNFTPQTHDLVETTIEFTCNKFESPQINDLAKHLLRNSLLLSNSLNFQSGYSPTNGKPLSSTKVGNSTVDVGESAITSIDTSTGRLKSGKTSYNSANQPIKFR